MGTNTAGRTSCSFRTHSSHRGTKCLHHPCPRPSRSSEHDRRHLFILVLEEDGRLLVDAGRRIFHLREHLIRAGAQEEAHERERVDADGAQWTKFPRPYSSSHAPSMDMITRMKALVDLTDLEFPIDIGAVHLKRIPRTERTARAVLTALRAAQGLPHDFLALFARRILDELALMFRKNLHFIASFASFRRVSRRDADSAPASIRCLFSSTYRTRPL